MEAVKPWTSPLRTFLNDTMAHLRSELANSLAASFRDLEKRQVYTIAKRHTKEWLKMHQARILAQLERIYGMETRKIYTMDDDSFQRHRVHEGHMLKRTRHFYRWKAHLGDTTSTKPEDWDKMTAEARRKEEIQTQKESGALGDDPYEVELGVASHVRGYYLTAAMRFIDVIAMHITSGLFIDLQGDIEQYLDRKMGLDRGNIDSEVFIGLMEEEQSTAEKRARLKTEMERFERAVREILELNQTVTKASIDNTTAASMHEEDQGMENADGDVDNDEV